MKYKLAVLIIATCIFAVYCLINGNKASVNNTIQIIEVCPKNFGSFSLGDDLYPNGWIELRNSSHRYIDLADYSVIVNDRIPIRLHPFELPPGDIRIVSFDKSIEFNEEYSSDIINCDLSTTGSVSIEFDCNIVDSICWTDVPTDVSICRFPSGEDSIEPMLRMCTANPGEYIEKPELIKTTIVAKPIFNVPSGIYDTPFKLTISAPEDKYKIYYTTDCSIPNENSNLYTTPIDLIAIPCLNNLSNRTDISDQATTIPKDIDHLRVIRAILVDIDGNSSDVLSAVYGFSSEMKYSYSKYPIISLVVDPIDLLDPDRGIMVLGRKWEEYTASLMEQFTPDEVTEKLDNPPDDIKRNYDYRGREWERRADIQYIVNGTETCNITCGIRNKARTSAIGYQKAFNIYARDFYSNGAKYLPSSFTHLSYPAKSISLKKLLRGNPFPEKSINELIGNAIEVGTQKCIPVQLFINGEWWGSYELMEKCDETYYNAHYGVAKCNLDMIKGYDISKKNESAFEDYTDLMNWILDNDFSDNENWENLKLQVDIYNVIDFYIIQTYLANYDYDEYWNNIIWRSKTPTFNGKYNDGRWRYTLYDLDGSRLSYTSDFLSQAPNTNHVAAIEQPVLNAILQNPEGRELFYRRYHEIASSYLSDENTSAYLASLYSDYYDFIKSGFEWQDSQTNADAVNDWINVDLNFWKHRYQYAIGYLEALY